MSPEPVFSEVLQIGLVVKDVDQAMRKYWEVMGIGPWAVYTMSPDNMRDTMVHGQAREFAMKAAFAELGSMQIELIQPLDEVSIYAEFLKEHGEGLHHAACAVADFQGTIDRLAKEGVAVLTQGVTEQGMGFAYLDTQNAMSCITEIYDIPEDYEFPASEYVYPLNS